MAGIIGDLEHDYGEATSDVAHALVGGILPSGQAAPEKEQYNPPPTSPIPLASGPVSKEGNVAAPTKDTTPPSTAAFPILKGGDTPAKPSAMQTDVDEYLKTYANELTQLGPEYGEEMKYLAPYLTNQQPGIGLEQAQANAMAGGKGVQTPQSSPGNTAINNADEVLGQTIASQTTPGFGGIAKAAQQYETTVPYSEVLSSVLGAQKNELLYGSIPNFSSVNTQGWGPSMQALYQYLSEAAGGGSATGVSPGSSASQLTTQQQELTTQQQEAAMFPSTYTPPASSVTGGGNVG